MDRTPENLKRIRKACVDPYEFFCLYFEGWRKSGDRVVENAPYQIADMRRLGKALMFRNEDGSPKPAHFARAEPREFSKSTRAFVTLLWALLNGWRTCAIIIRENLDTSKGVLAEIQRIVGDPEHPLTIAYELQDWPRKASSTAGLRWSTELLHLPTLDGRIATLLPRSPGKPVRGTVGADNPRPDFIMLDDIEDKDDVRNPDLREKLREWLFKDVWPLGSAAVLDMRGTLLHYDSLLATALKLANWDTAKYAALTEAGESLWPQRHSTEYLLGKKAAYEDAGALNAWQSEYMNNPVDSTDAMFPSSAWNTYGKGAYSAPPKRGEFSMLVVGADTANSAKSTADWSVFEAWGLMADGTFHLVEAVRGRWDWHTLMTMAIAMNERLRPDVWCVEKAASGQQLIQEFQRLNVPVEAVEATSDLVARAQPLQPAFAQRLLWRPANGFDWLTEEFEMFPNAPHDDSVAAAIAAWRRLVYKRPIRIYV